MCRILITITAYSLGRKQSRIRFSKFPFSKRGLGHFDAGSNAQNKIWWISSPVIVTLAKIISLE